VAFENVSLDGYFAGRNGEIDWFVAPHAQETQENEFAIESLKSGTTLLFGRVTYELMARYWPTEDAKRNNPLLAEKMNSASKVVFSRTLDKVDWQNSRLIKDNIEDEIKKMKSQSEKDMAILGSGSILSAFAQVV
jgi:dihydrofolate reductase